MAVIASIPSMANYLTTGYWGGSGHNWIWDPVSVNLSGLTASEQTLAQTALNLWHEVCDVDFSFTTLPGASIVFTHNGTGAETTSTWTGTRLDHADINIGSSFGGGAGTGIGGYFFQTYIHEIGHALGLGHQGPYNNNGVYGVDNIYTNDTWQNSIMSYFAQSNYGGASTDYVITPQMVDIYAVQMIYGTQSTPIRATDTVYGFNSTAGSFYNFSTYSVVPAMTIYDMGGNDKLDASLYSFSQTIDLTPGSFSSIGGLIGNVGIYLTSIIENATGGSGNDIIIGNNNNNNLIAGDGNDTLKYTGGYDLLNGGNGLDTADFTPFNYSVWVNLAATSGIEAWYQPGGVWTTIADLNSVENLTGTVYGDTLLGDNNSNMLTYTGGYDTFNGSGGVDTVNFSKYGYAVWVDLTTADEAWSTGQSTLVGSWYKIADITNVETLVGSNYADNIRGNDIANELYGGSGNDLLMGRGGNDFIDGGSGIDTAIFTNSADLYSYQIVGSNILVTGTNEGTDTVLDSVENFQFGTQIISRADLIGAIIPPQFTNGNDTVSLPIIGGSFNALGGDDHLSYNGGYINVTGGTGTDTISFTGFGSAVWVNLESTGYQAWTTDQPTLGTAWRPLGVLQSIENITGTAYSDYLKGDAGDNIIKYGGGYDTIVGSGGSDTLDFSNFASAVWVDLTTTGSDAWTRDTTNLTTGTWREIADVSTVENLIGTNGSDLLRGGAENNRFTGGAGNDTLTGDGGNDTFVFKALGSIDTITDFVHGSDMLEISATGFGGGLIAGATASVVNVDDHTTYSGTGSSFLYDDNTLYWDPNGGIGADAIAFAQLSGISTLMPTDFHIV